MNNHQNSVYNIGIFKYTESKYCRTAPFRPSKSYPEYPFKSVLNDSNDVYNAIRESFKMMGFDSENFGSNEWNPLGKYIKPGNTVVIKPNLVRDFNAGSGDLDCLFTQPSLVAPVIDYVLIALSGKGRIIIGDAPVQDCNFEKLISESGYKDLVDWYQDKTNIPIGLRDFRGLKSVVIDGVMHSETVNSNSIVVDLKEESEFCDLDEKQLDNLRITNYDPALLKQHHNKKTHEYCIAGEVLEADVFINIPKPKCHRKAGATIALKNIVGINARKEYLPHHTVGSISDGGDEYLNRSLIKKYNNFLWDKRNYFAQTKERFLLARLLWKMISLNNRFLKVTNSDKHEEGSWYGNNTISKTILDINKILLYANKNGILCDTVQRKTLTIADMLVCGEGEGPLMPTSKSAGIIAIGENFVAFDKVVSTIMGFSYRKIPSIYNALIYDGKYRIFLKSKKIMIISNEIKYDNKDIDHINEKDTLMLKPSDGWKDHIEIENGK